MSCNNQATKTVVIGNSTKDHPVADTIAKGHKCGDDLDDRFGFVCSDLCAVKYGWTW
jgi:hypothetical protein